MLKNIRRPALYSAILASAGLVSQASAAVVFQDNFSTSTLNSTTPSALTGTSTSYQLTSAKTWVPTPSVASGDLKFGIAATTGGVVEAQARFTNTPITLASAGDSVELTLTFTDTSGILTQAMGLGFGLYNSGGVAPLAGGLNATATSSTSAHTTDGVANWQGYVAQLSQTASGRIMDREAQNVGTVTDNAQDLATLGSSSQSYSFPAAATIGSTQASGMITLVAGNQYTEDMLISRNADGSLTIGSNLFAGVGTAGTNLSSMTSNTSTTPLTTTFDGLAWGWRASANASATTMDTNSITVTANIGTPVPEPASLGVLILAAAALFMPRRQKA